ncbi:HAD-superfamily hydrolase [Tothia fuscella]|uniref:HAD-superfamily hydrolase n=1 Tax=Tothia fuscella TaxID=1048955 RepID=A0A9P4U1P0_9PEZI|nr:HAD-superfamily hydrolase [Tothia fuscella]
MSSYTPNREFAFAFDIDGVIYRSSSLCEGAVEAIQYLNTHQIPYIFLTNGGGKTEEVRARDMATKLNIPVSTEQFIQSHTPFKQYLPEFADKTVLVLGGVGDDNRNVAEAYGFKNVVTTADIVTAFPNYWPFDEMHGDYFRKLARPLPSTPLQIAAIFVFSSPRDWGLDQQICLDLLLSQKGLLGTPSRMNGNGMWRNGNLTDSQPKIFFSNPNVDFSTSYHLPRLAQGSFKAGLEGVWKAKTGLDLPSSQSVQVGKPTQLQFQYGENALRAIAGKDLKRVYMVGDGPRSDIAGANQYRSPFKSTWKSILVQTGMHVAGTVPEFLPMKEVPNVLDAVRWALEQEGFPMQSRTPSPSPSPTSGLSTRQPNTPDRRSPSSSISSNIPARSRKRSRFPSSRERSRSPPRSGGRFKRSRSPLPVRKSSPRSSPPPQADTAKESLPQDTEMTGTPTDTGPESQPHDTDMAENSHPGPEPVQTPAQDPPPPSDSDIQGRRPPMSKGERLALIFPPHMQYCLWISSKFVIS